MADKAMAPSQPAAVAVPVAVHKQFVQYVLQVRHYPIIVPPSTKTT